MQSGTTGINSIRIYNPIKQGIDHDPRGIFIRRWIPELANCSDKHIHTPWLEKINCPQYPPPIVEEKDARREASKKIYEIKKMADHKKVANAIFKKHGSRKKRVTVKNTERQRKLSL
tara:strand:- start:915 stop:1265 length:351 start_codon:yes stop_codon:yes gene_type:complete